VRDHPPNQAPEAASGLGRTRRRAGAPIDPTPNDCLVANAIAGPELSGRLDSVGSDRPADAKSSLESREYSTLGSGPPEGSRDRRRWGDPFAERPAADCTQRDGRSAAFSPSSKSACSRKSAPSHGGCRTNHSGTWCINWSAGSQRFVAPASAHSVGLDRQIRRFSTCPSHRHYSSEFLGRLRDSLHGKGQSSLSRCAASSPHAPRAPAGN
jgi:hypothetical protein